jgi:hypothetical protein
MKNTTNNVMMAMSVPKSPESSSGFVDDEEKGRELDGVVGSNED